MRFVRGFPSTMMDEYQLNITNILRHAATNFPEREVVSRNLDGSLFRYSYGEAYERVSRLANVLEELGVDVGDRVGVLSWNTHRFFELFFAIPGIGAVLLEMNLRLHPREIAYVANHSGAKVIFVDESLLPIAEAIAPSIGVEKYVVMTDGETPETKLPEVYSYEELLRKASKDYDFPMVDETSAYAACYTSGTTGKSEGSLLLPPLDGAPLTNSGNRNGFKARRRLHAACSDVPRKWVGCFLRCNTGREQARLPWEICCRQPCSGG